MYKRLLLLFLLAFFTEINNKDFLVIDNIEKNKRVTSADDSNISLDNFKLFASGVNQGFGLFNNLQFQDDCDLNDEEIILKAKEIYSLFKNLSIVNSYTTLTSSMNQMKEIIQLITHQSSECENWGKEISRVFNKLEGYVEKVSYFGIISHIYTNSGIIYDAIDKSLVLLQNDEFMNAGITTGETIKYAFFWNL